jgi:hypothetical protein
LPRVRQGEGCVGMSRGAAHQCCALCLVLKCSSPSSDTRDVVLAADVMILSPPSARLRRVDGDLRREVVPERRHNCSEDAEAVAGMDACAQARGEQVVVY